MKRPDLFVCIDSANRRGLARPFGVSQTSLRDYPGYWDLLQLVWRCPWHNSPRPGDSKGRELWDARVALLDAFFHGC